MTANDKRECVRLSIQRVVDFAVKDRVYRGSIENYCNSGAFIKTKGCFSEEQDISMTIESPSEKRTGKINRITPYGIGVEFS